MDNLHHTHDFIQTNNVSLCSSFSPFSSEYLLKLSEIESSASGAFEPFAQATCDILTSSLLCNSNFALYTNQLLQDETAFRHQLNSASSLLDGFLKAEDQTISNIFVKGDVPSHLFGDKKGEYEDQANHLLHLWSNAQKPISVSELSGLCSFPDLNSRCSSNSSSLSNSAAFSVYTSRASSIEQINSFFQPTINPTAIYFGSNFSTPKGRRSLYLDLLQQIKRVQSNWAAHEKSFNHHFYALLKCQQLKDFAKYDMIFEQLLVHSDIVQTDKQLITQNSTILNPALQQNSSSHVGLPVCNPACLPIYLKVIEELDMLRLLNEPKFKPLSTKDLSENISPDVCSAISFDQASFLNAKLCESDNIKQQMPMKGIHRWQDGATYEGEFKNNRMHGYGVYRFLDGSVYEGQWKENNMHGYGRLTTAHGYYYEGQFYQNEQHGTGTYGEPSGLKYIGTWKHGQLDGRATRVSAIDTVQYGEWQQGKFIKWTSAKYSKKVDKLGPKTNCKANTPTSVVNPTSLFLKNESGIDNPNIINDSVLSSPITEGTASSYVKPKETESFTTHDCKNNTENEDSSKHRSKSMQLKAWVNEAKRMPRHPQVNFNKVLGRWYAIVKNPKTNKRTWKGFSCSIHGFKKARQMAIDWVINYRNENSGALACNAKTKDVKDVVLKFCMNNDLQDSHSESLSSLANQKRNYIRKVPSEKVLINNDLAKPKAEPIQTIAVAEQNKKFSTSSLGKKQMKKKISRNYKKNWVTADASKATVNVKRKNRQTLMKLLVDEMSNNNSLNIAKQSIQESPDYCDNDGCTPSNANNLRSLFASNISKWNKITIKDLFKNKYKKNYEKFTVDQCNNKNNTIVRYLNTNQYQSNCDDLALWNKKSFQQMDPTEKKVDRHVLNEEMQQDNSFWSNKNDCSHSATTTDPSSRKTNVSPYLPSICKQQRANDMPVSDCQKLPTQVGKEQRASSCSLQDQLFFSPLQTDSNPTATISYQNKPSASELQLQCGKRSKKKKKEPSDGSSVWLRQDHWGKGWRCVWVDEKGTQRSKFFGESKWGKEGCRHKAESYMFLAAQTKPQVNV